MRNALLLALLCAAPAGAADAARKRLAGLVVRSKEYVVRREPRREEEFIGDVSYKHQGREIYSDWAMRRHDLEQWQAKGHVRLVWRMEDGTVVEAKGEKATHDGDSGIGRLEPKPGGIVDYRRMVRGQEEPDRGEARSMIWDSDDDRVRLLGDVRLWGPTGRAWASEADYASHGQLLLLTGRRPVVEPVTEKWEGAVQADQLKAEERTRLHGEGRVEGWLLFRGKEKYLRRQGL